MRATRLFAFGISLFALALAGCGGGGGGDDQNDGILPVGLAKVPDLVPAHAPGGSQHYYTKVAGGVRIYIHNAGTGLANDCLVRVYYITPHQIPGIPQYWATDATTGVIPAGATTSVVVDPPLPVMAQVQPLVIGIAIDVDEEIPELLEDNNGAQDVYL